MVPVAPEIISDEIYEGEGTMCESGIRAVIRSVKTA
jgi:hypothetical protein